MKKTPNKITLELTQSSATVLIMALDAEIKSILSKGDFDPAKDFFPYYETLVSIRVNLADMLKGDDQK